MGAWIEIPYILKIMPPKVVAPFMGAWIEIVVLTSAINHGVMSHPSWVRGLKSYRDVAGFLSFHQSHPSWVRGLKLLKVLNLSHDRRVAPFMGAWIEISNMISSAKFFSKVAPFTGAWIEINLALFRIEVLYEVAPFTGAWIEISVWS